MRLSRIVLVLVAVVAAGLAAFLALGSGSGQPQQQAPAQVVQEARAQVLVAKADIGLGERLSPDNLQWQDWPEGAVRAEYITSKRTPRAVSIISGVAIPRWRRSRQTSKPLLRGSITSRMIASKRSFVARARPVSPS